MIKKQKIQTEPDKEVYEMTEMAYYAPGKKDKVK